MHTLSKTWDIVSGERGHFNLWITYPIHGHWVIFFHNIIGSLPRPSNLDITMYYRSQRWPRREICMSMTLILALSLFLLPTSC
ncbi:hypothetical protein EV361DRAFT_936921 [Lentinula raphanica]|nr:hypothetical protein EV361DRAFT_936921 [Lentinula raphanica]